MPIHLSCQEAVRDFYTLAYRAVPCSGGFLETHSQFLPLFLLLLFLFCAFQFAYSNEAKLPWVIAFLSHILPCELILSKSSNVTLPKCRTLSHNFSCSSVGILNPFPVISVGTEECSWCGQFRQQKGAGFRGTCSL